MGHDINMYVMNIEIVEFYPVTIEKNYITGSLHVYLIDIQVDIRGVYFLKKKDIWVVELPYRKGMDAETGELIRFPVFSFVDREKTKELVKTIREKAREFISKKILDNPSMYVGSCPDTDSK